MGVEAILRVIEAEAEAEARRIVDDARRAAEAAIAEAEERAAGAVTAAAERLAAELEAERLRAVNAARRRRLEAEAAALVAAIETVIEAARAELAAIADARDEAGQERWRLALRRWLEAALAVTGRPARVVARPADVPLLAQVAGIELSPDESLPPGLRVTSGDGRVEVEATLPARLERAKARGSEAVARVIGLDLPAPEAAVGRALAMPGDGNGEVLA